MDEKMNGREKDPMPSAEGGAGDRSFRGEKGRQSAGEEIANSISHGLGLLASLAGAPFLLLSTVDRGDAWNVLGAAAFCGAMFLLYLSSTLYHALPDSKAKQRFRTLDHGAIFLLIAGTYSPLTLGVLRGAWGWTLFGLVWGIAVLGLTLEAAGILRRHPRLSMGLYLAMGWLAVVAIRPLWNLVPLQGLLWLAAGGVAYTAGTVFYSWKGMPYGHFVWHLFVVSGTTCHFFAVLWYAV